MILSELVSIYKNSNMTIAEIAEKSGSTFSNVAKIMSGHNSNPGLKVLQSICDALNCKLSININPNAAARPMTSQNIAVTFDRLDERGKQIIALLTSAESHYITESKPEEPLLTKTIPLFLSPAAAGYISPVFGDDYDELEVPSDFLCDFAIKIRGESMEPEIADGSIAYVKRSQEIRNGDIGVFFVNGDVLCKQYFIDTEKNLSLISLNRNYKDSDRFIPTDSEISVFCYGKVVDSPK